VGGKVGSAVFRGHKETLTAPFAGAALRLLTCAVYRWPHGRASGTRRTRDGGRRRTASAGAHALATAGTVRAATAYGWPTRCLIPS